MSASKKKSRNTENKKSLSEKILKKGPYQYQNKNNPATIPLIFTETELEAGGGGGGEALVSISFSTIFPMPNFAHD